MDEEFNDTEQRKIIQTYALFGIGLVLSMVPAIWAAVVSGVLIFAVLIAAYVMRWGKEKESLVENHMTFIISTIWAGSILALVTMSVAAFYLFDKLNNAPMEPCMLRLNNYLMGATAPDMVMIEGILNGCWQNYWTLNLKAFVIGGIIAAGPVLLYFLVRYVRGFTRARNGYRIAKPKSWL